MNGVLQVEQVPQLWIHRVSVLSYRYASSRMPGRTLAKRSLGSAMSVLLLLLRDLLLSRCSERCSFVCCELSNAIGSSSFFMSPSDGCVLMPTSLVMSGVMPATAQSCSHYSPSTTSSHPIALSRTWVVHCRLLRGDRLGRSLDFHEDRVDYLHVDDERVFFVGHLTQDVDELRRREGA